MTHLRLVGTEPRKVTGGSVNSDVRNLILLEEATRRLELLDFVRGEIFAAVSLRDVDTLKTAIRKLPSLAELFKGLVEDHERSVL